MPKNIHAVIADYQVYENYGAHDWDGKGVCPQGWKPKGGSQNVIVEGVTLQEIVCNLNAYIRLAVHLEENSNYWREHFLGYRIVCMDPADAKRQVRKFLDNLKEYDRGESASYLKWVFDKDIIWDLADGDAMARADQQRIRESA